MKLTVITIALVSNYLLDWSYKNGAENHTSENDTVVVAASHRYSQMSPLKWFFLGKNYREEWSVPVAMPVFHLKTTKGGFRIERLGGGEQTKSLHLINNDGSKWVLRSVDKNVREALSEKIQGTFIQNIVQDQISAAYPYATLTIFDLSKAVNVPAPVTELYYIPDDPALGKYRPIFAHTVCFLSPKNINGKDTETENTDFIYRLLDSSNHYQLQQEKILTARLLDMLIADWDRHKGQWDWAFIDSGHTVFIYPVPEDRDQAFFLSTGMLTKIVRLFGLPHLVGFKEKPKKLIKLNNKVHEFDRYFLNSLNRKQWEHAIKIFQAKLTDSAIQTAVNKLPPEVYSISGKEIRKKLTERRNGLFSEALRYYDFLAKNVTVNSTKDPEIFLVKQSYDSVTVTVRRKQDNRLVYHRVFYPEETKEIDIKNIGQNDQLSVSGKQTSIKLRY